LDFSLPDDLTAYLAQLDRFIADRIKPLEQSDDNQRFFDHRREWARTDFDKGGLPRREWEELLRSAKDLADDAGHLRFAIPKRYGGRDGSNLWMAVIREHFASKGLGLHNDLQNEHSIVGNFPIVTMLDRYGRDDQKAMIEGSITGKYRITLPDRARSRLGRDPHGNPRHARHARRCGRVDHQWRKNVDHGHACRDPLRHFRPHFR
jgi:butyryl-CoA dehydrogenase